MLGRGKSYIWFLAGLLAIAVGCWPSFYGDPLSNDAWHIAHGVAATLWVLLLITQSLLIGRGNRRLHERHGILPATMMPRTTSGRGRGCPLSRPHASSAVLTKTTAGDSRRMHCLA